jgi:hypothetical protein
MSDTSRLPRPWFIALAVPWSLASGFEELQRTLIRTHALATLLPAHHSMVPEQRWHSTLFVVARANGVAEASAEDQVLSWLAELSAQPGLVSTLEASFAPIELEAHELTCFDGATTVQFRGLDHALSRLREGAASALATPVRKLTERWNTTEPGRLWSERHGCPLVESMLDDRTKNIGDASFGAVARSPVLDETLSLRWRRAIDPVRLRIHSALLVASDETLCNPRALEAATLVRAANI